jgi:hypothetical protein
MGDPVDSPSARRRAGGAVFVLICAPCFVAFLAVLAPAAATALSTQLPALVWLAPASFVGGIAFLYFMLRRRRRALETAACPVPAAAGRPQT